MNINVLFFNSEKMNICFIDPTYLKPDVLNALFNALKVKVAFSFIQEKELPKEIIDFFGKRIAIIAENGNQKYFSDQCVFSLRQFIEQNVELSINKFGKLYSDLSSSEKEGISSSSAYNNLLFLDDFNVLIILHLESSYDFRGNINVPYSESIGTLQKHLPTQIAQYTLNILHKKYQHYYYSDQVAFVLINEFFKTSFRYFPKNNLWKEYYIMNPKHNFDFSSFIKNKIASQLLQYIGEKNGRKYILPILKEEFKEKCKRFYDDMYDIIKREEEYKQAMDEAVAEAAQDRKDIEDDLRFLGISDRYEW